MNCKTILSLSLLLASFGAGAKVLTPAQALGRLNDDDARRLPARLRQSAPAPVRTVVAKGQPALYLFNTGGRLTVVTAESEAVPLVGYSCSFDADSMPPALDYMLDYYAAQIADLRAGDVMVSAVSSGDDYAPIAPICTTRWNQMAPYNDLCPEIDDQRAPTGCVATAMAQVLKVYGRPSRGFGGEYTYPWENGKKDLSLNYSDITFKWDEMEDSYSDTDNAPAVAELMQAVGYAANMNYGAGQSGASSSSMADGLVRNFNFNYTTIYEQRSWYTLRQWQDKIYDVLASGKPVYHDGANPDGRAAHAFVVDGYSSNGFFHLNWGWGGMSDGYYRLSALDPGSQGVGGSSAGYDIYQGAIFGLKQGHANDLTVYAPQMYVWGEFRPTELNVPLGAEVTFGGGIYNAGTFTIPSVKPAVSFEAADGSVAYVSTVYNFNNLRPGYGSADFTLPLPAELAEGRYTVRPAAYNPNTDSYTPAHADVNGAGYVIADVAGGNVTFTIPELATVKAVNLEVPAQIHPNAPFYLSCTLTNDGQNTYYGAVKVSLTAGKDVVALGAMAVDLNPGESSEINLPFYVPYSLAEGTYMLTLIDDNGREVAEARSVSVTPRPPFGPVNCTDITVNNAAQNNLSFDLTFSCPDNFYSDNVAVTLRTGRTSGDEVLYLHSPRPVVLHSGESTTVNIGGSFDDGTIGRYYYVAPWYINYQTNYRYPACDAADYKRFKLLAPEESSISAVGTEANAPAEYFDLQGRSVKNPQHGVYIRRQGSKVQKIKL